MRKLSRRDMVFFSENLHIRKRWRLVTGFADGKTFAERRGNGSVWLSNTPAVSITFAVHDR